MNLQEKSYTELKALFDKVYQAWQENILQRNRIQEKECIKYSDFVRNRADLRQLARENAKLHNKLVQIDLEIYIRTWTGLND